MRTNGFISTKTPWWYQYRQQRYKKRNYLTMEMIIRRSFVETLKEYLDTTSLGGIRQIRDSNNSRLQRLGWTAIFCVTSLTVCLFLHSTWMMTFNSPLLVTIDSYTHPIKDIDFPAVSLCNFNRISKKAVEKYIIDIKKLQKLDDIDTIKAYEYLRQFDRLIDYRYDHKLQSIIDTSPLNESLMNIAYLMSKFAPRCEDMLVKCKWGNKAVNCSEIFRNRKTGLGYCCTFNYVFDLNDSADRLVKRQVLAGKRNGLTVIADPMPEDNADQLGQKNGFQVLIHDARHFPEFRGGRVHYRIIQTRQMEALQIESIKQYSTAEVHKYSSQTRQCLFHNELKETFKNRYSYSGCLLKCRMAAIESLCKCIPFFYPIENHKSPKICTLSHLRCLDKHNAKLLYLYPAGLKNTAGLETEVADSVDCPGCLPDCELTYTYTRQFKLSLSKMTRVGHNNFLRDVNLTNKCVLNVYHPTSVGTLHRLDAVAYWFDILSGIGGFSGVIMGIGCFTFSEMFYYVIIRFPRTVYINYKKHH